jgi:uncharacterized protein (DUF3820 family)
VRSLRGLWTGVGCLNFLRDGLQLRENWIQAPVLIATPSKVIRLFGIGSRRIYIDMPLHYYTWFIEEVYTRSLKFMRLLEEALEKGPDAAVQELKRYGELLERVVKRYNEELAKDNLGWFKLYVRRNKLGSIIASHYNEYVLDKKNYVIMYRINWDGFYDFITEFIVGDRYSLPQKYEYIYTVKYHLLKELWEREFTGNLDTLRTNIRIHVLPYIAEAEKSILKYGSRAK